MLPVWKRLIFQNTTSEVIFYNQKARSLTTYVKNRAFLFIQTMKISFSLKLLIWKLDKSSELGVQSSVLTKVFVGNQNIESCVFVYASVYPLIMSFIL